MMLSISAWAPAIEWRFESADHVIAVKEAVAFDLGRQPERRINFPALWKIEMLRHHADHRPLDIVDGDRLVDDVWIAAEASLPETVGDDRYCVCSGLVLFRGEAAAHNRFETGDIDEISRDEVTPQAFRGIDSA